MALKMAGRVSGTPGLEVLPYIPQAVRFSADPKLRNTDYVLSRLREHEVWTLLVADTDLDQPFGRPRAKGEWVGMMAQMVMDGKLDVQKFNDNLNAEDWHRAGFAEPLSYPTLHRRLTELEDHTDAVWRATIPLIREVKTRFPIVGRVIHIDGTPFRTNARLHHCCLDDNCQKKIGSTPKTTGQLSPKELAEIKRRELDLEDNGVALDAIVDVTDERVATDPDGSKWRYYRYNGHLYRSRDTTAGVRTYAKPAGRDKETGKKRESWQGGNAVRAIDAATGATLAVIVIRADESEKDTLGRLLDKVIEATGEAPQVVTADKAMAFAACVELCAAYDAELVMPLRKPGNDKQISDLATSQVDADRVPRCPHCGGPGTLDGPRLGPYRDTRTKQPRIAFRCRLGLTPRCGKTLSIGRDQNWLLLSGIPRTQKLFHVLMEAHRPREHAHDDDRDNFAVFGKDYAQMPHRPGLGWARLRGEMALLVNWFRLGLRLGVIGGHDRIHAPGVAFLHAGRGLARVLRRRRDSGIDLPYGPAAERLGFALPEKPPPDPPPKRRRKTPRRSVKTSK